MSTSNNQNNNDLAIWIAIVVLFAVGLWPISLFLLVRQLMGSNKKKTHTRSASDVQREWRENAQKAEQKTHQAASGAQSAADRVWNTAEQAVSQAEAWLEKEFGKTGTAQKTTTQKTSAKKSTAQTRSTASKSSRQKSAKTSKLKLPRGKGLTVAGGIVSGIFGFAFLMQFVEAASWGSLEYYVTDLVALLGFLCLGLVLLFCGLAKTSKGKRYRKYLNLIGTRRTVSITALAKTSGTKRRKVMDDLQDMLDDGLLPMGYLDLSRDLLVISEEGIPDEEPIIKAEPEPEPAQDDNAILAEIRAVNDAIPDPVMSEKIDRIGEITGKILDYQRQNPGKDSQLRSFLNYYLPTTLKILRSYAQLDAQGVEGENITAAKVRIEGMMDKVVEGFENQLDKLFADSAMDISSDVAVLEKMLEKDGLSGNSGMTLGG